METVQDIGGLAALVQNSDDVDTIGGMLSRLARFVSMSIAERGSVSTTAATAWAILAHQAASREERAFSDGARFLLWALFERADFSDASFLVSFGSAARALLALAWSLDPQLPSLTAAAIRFVAKSFGSDPVASRTLLQQILEEPRFTGHAHEEAPWLAEGIGSIIPYDPEFAAIVYASLFGRSAPQEGASWLGGHRSRILPLSSNRKQDYEHARWHLARALRPFLQVDPKAGVTAVIGAALGLAAQDSPRRRRAPEILRIETTTHTLRVVDDLLSLQDWRQRGRRSGDPEDRCSLGPLLIFLGALISPRFGRLLTWLCALKPALRSGPVCWASPRIGSASRTTSFGRSSLNRRSSACAAWRATPLSIWLRSIRPVPR